MNHSSTSANSSVSRRTLYVALNAAFVVYVVIAAAMGESDSQPWLYLSLLFALCSTPLLLFRALNDRYAIYSAFLLIYFVSFGLLDLLTLTSGVRRSMHAALLTESEVLILVCGAAFSLSYCAAAAQRTGDEFRQIATRDWPLGLLLLVGFLLWAVGTFATWYWNIRLTVRAGDFDSSTGPFVTAILVAGRYVQPLGLLLIAYAHTITRSRMLTLATIGVVIIQVVLGFISDTKGGAMLGGILVIVASVLVKGKIPRIWVAAGVAFVILAFPVFQAHRAVVINEQGMSNAQGAQDISKSLSLSLENQKRVVGEGAQSFFERSSVKSSVEMIVSRTGVDVPFQEGHTLMPLATVFIPRLLWPTKLDVQTGVLVNTEFGVTENAVTYISPSHLGELYWNFGWAGAIAGLVLLGLLLGWLNRICDMSKGISATRLLIIAITIFQLCARFEGTIASEYSVWLRSIVGILVLHWIVGHWAPARSQRTASPPADEHRIQPLKFPNLMH